MEGLNLKKEVIRTKVVDGILSEIIYESEGNETLKDLILRIGKEQALIKIYKEEHVTYDFLFQEYSRFRMGEKSRYFAWMYVMNPQFGVVLDAHIYLYHFDSQIYDMQREFFPWIYTDSKKFLGDTWWSEDEEILADIGKLTIIDFLDKYKGY